MEKRTPVILITGFLGAGKTTFINWILTRTADLNISVILNEFGDIKLESQFIKSKNGNVIELANGCMCCVARADIPHVVHYILENSPKTEHILIEASGASDPDPIIATIQQLEYAEPIRFDANIVIVDSVNFPATREKYPIVLTQIGEADIILVTKTKQSGPQMTQKVIASVKNLLPRVCVLEFTERMSPSMFLDPQVTGIRHENIGEEHHHEHESFKTYWFTGDYYINVGMFEAVMKKLPEGIVRAKGLLKTKGKDTELKVLVQYVGSRLELFDAPWKSDEEHKTAVLFIGKDFDEANLEKQLRTCDASIPKVST